MAISRAAIIALLPLVANVNGQFTATCTEDQLENCNGQRYCPDSYTCYNDSELCPVQGGVKYESCCNDATYACYNPYEYK